MEYTDFEIFKDKKYSDLLSDMYKGVDEKDTTIINLIQSLQNMVKGPDDALMIVPLIKDYLDVSVKNSDQLNKIAMTAIKSLELTYKIQKDIIDKQNPEVSSDTNNLLSDDVKKQLRDIANKTKKENKVVNDNLNKVNEKAMDILQKINDK